MADITSISIRLVPRQGPLVGHAIITIDREIVVKGISIFQGTRYDPDRLYVQFPSAYRRGAELCSSCAGPLERSSRDKCGNDQVVHPISHEARVKYERAITEAYQKEVARREHETIQHGYGPYVLVQSMSAQVATCSV